jgi:F5/8 type C domain-containing protein
MLLFRLRAKNLTYKLQNSRKSVPKFLAGKLRWFRAEGESQMKFMAGVVFFFVLSLINAFAQTIDVDITPAHETNRFIPNQTLGAGIDRIPVTAIDKDLVPAALDKVFTAGWGPVTYRQNTELFVQAWHWNPNGTWSDPSGKGYFTGSTQPSENIRYSYGYDLPHRGVTRNDGTGNAGFSRLTDGDLSTYWKSNPYLTRRWTAEGDSAHPQWVLLDLQQYQMIDSIRIAWADPYATDFLVQYWTGTGAEEPMHYPTRGVWKTFPFGAFHDAKGGTQTLRISGAPMPVRFLRIWMTASSNTCDTHGSSDPRNCVGYAIREIYLGATTADSAFHDVMRHTPDQEQTATYCSSVDPWHAPADLGSTKQAQVGFDLFFRSGVTHGLPAVIPVAMLYDTPENAAAEIAYLKTRGYQISYVELGEEADGQFTLPEDYAELYIQAAKAIHRVWPGLKLGGPSFTGENQDIETWPDGNGNTSWTGRFIDYLKSHNSMDELSFFSFEHYPYEQCHIPWGSLYDEPELVSHIMQVWHEDGVPENMPLLITESNLSSAASETNQDIFAGLWLADYVGAFLNSGGKGLYYFHYLPLQMEHGCDDSPGTFGMFTIDKDYQIQQYLSQYFASQLINLEWIQPGNGVHRVFPAKGNITDGAGHSMLTAYALERPDGDWSVMIVNRDQMAAHKFQVNFRDDVAHRVSSFTGPVAVSTFGSEQYKWHPASTVLMAHDAAAAMAPVIANTKGYADPDGPSVHATKDATANTEYEIPEASIMVVKGKLK